MDEMQIAKMLGVGATSWAKYKKQYPEFAKALSGGKIELADKLYSALKRKALGFRETVVEVTEIDNEKGSGTITKTKEVYFPPDLGSIHLLLKNIDENWHNDDATTIELRKKELELKEKHLEQSEW